MNIFNFQEETAALDQAADRAMELVREFAEHDPQDASTDNPWRNPNRMFEQLDEARLKVLNASNVLKEAVAKVNKKEIGEPSYDESDFRAQFMDMITEAFADVLTEMKESNEEVDVDILADCLQSGMDLMSQEDREFFMQDLEDDEESGEDEGDANENKLTPHEARRQALGFLPATAA